MCVDLNVWVCVSVNVCERVCVSEWVSEFECMNKIHTAATVRVVSKLQPFVGDIIAAIVH